MDVWWGFGDGVIWTFSVSALDYCQWESQSALLYKGHMVIHGLDIEDCEHALGLWLIMQNSL